MPGANVIGVFSLHFDDCDTVGAWLYGRIDLVVCGTRTEERRTGVEGAFNGGRRWWCRYDWRWLMKVIIEIVVARMWRRGS